MPTLKVDVLSSKNLGLTSKKSVFFILKFVDKSNPHPLYSLGIKQPLHVFSLGEERFEIKLPDFPKLKRKEKDYKIKQQLHFTKFDPYHDSLLIEVFDFDEQSNPTNIGRVEMKFTELKKGKPKLRKLRLSVNNDSEITICLTAVDFDIKQNPETKKSSSINNNLKSSKTTQIRHFTQKEVKRDTPHIAKGSYGIVYTGKVANIKEKVVIKDMDILSQNSIDEWKKEIDLMTLGSCPYTVSIYGYSYSDTSLTIIMEYMPKGSLFDVLHKRHEKISIIQRMRMARHCALGLDFLHRSGIIHRDVKSMNILVSDDYSCKLTDFGCSKIINDGKHSIQHLNTANSGTPLWMAPEVKKGLPYDFSADIYSLGLVIYELFENKLPHYNQITQTTELPSQYKSKYIVSKCVTMNPKERLTASQVVDHLNLLITNILTHVKDLLPKEDEKAIRDILAKKKGKDSIDEELGVMYKYLLTKDPEAVDDLINKAFSGHKQKLKNPLPNNNKVCISSPYY